jgi:hypothetical protein
LLYVGPFILPRRFGFRVEPGPLATDGHAASFPVWGSLGLVLALCTWAVAWFPLPGLEYLSRNTFTLLWLGYILTVDGLVYRKKGSSLVTRGVGRFALLFVASAVLWWMFEYVNRFVENWYYVGLEQRTALGYIMYATPCFATVLPALLETSELLGAQSWLNRRYVSGPARPGLSRAAWSIGAVGAVGVLCMGIWPNLFFPFAWLGPLLVLLPVIERYLPEKSVLAQMGRGDYRALVALSLAGPCCGFFWEMWNYFSYPKWQYQVPYVMFGRVFEMPVLGYFGYIPFGWECLLMWQAWMIIFGVRHDTTEIVRAPQLQVVR